MVTGPNFTHRFTETRKLAASRCPLAKIDWIKDRILKIMSAFLLINFSDLGKEENGGENNLFRKVVEK